MNFFDTENLKAEDALKTWSLSPAKERTNPLTTVREEPACALERTFDPLGFGVESGNNHRQR
jgi:hypothetical protein